MSNNFQKKSKFIRFITILICTGLSIITINLIIERMIIMISIKLPIFNNIKIILGLIQLIWIIIFLMFIPMNISIIIKYIEKRSKEIVKRRPHSKTSSSGLTQDRYI